MAAESAVQFCPPSASPWGEASGFSLKRFLSLTRTLLPFRNVECLNLLLSSGADVRRRDKFGRCVNVQECIYTERVPNQRQVMEEVMEAGWGVGD